jgi:hypothetical protein
MVSYIHQWIYPQNGTKGRYLGISENDFIIRVFTGVMCRPLNLVS